MYFHMANRLNCVHLTGEKTEAKRGQVRSWEPQKGKMWSSELNRTRISMLYALCRGGGAGQCGRDLNHFPILQDPEHPGAACGSEINHGCELRHSWVSRNCPKCQTGSIRPKCSLCIRLDFLVKEDLKWVITVDSLGLGIYLMQLK